MKIKKRKKNCWEVMKCGREPGGQKIKELGACPVPVYDQLNGAHGGINAGRVCWIVAGTMCGGEIEGSFAKKYEDCRKCPFYHLVRNEEGDQFLITVDLIKWFSEKDK